MTHKATTPCWVITLEPEKAAVQKLLASLAAQGVSARTVAGVDGRKGMPALQTNERLAVGSSHWRHLCELSASEVGCYLAHLRALQLALESGLDRVCLLEDDVELEADFGRVLSELEQLPDDVEMIRLMGLKIRKRKAVKTLSDNLHLLVRPERGCLGTQGYLINRRGMHKVLAHGKNIFEPIDKLYDHFWEYDLQLYGVEPHLIWETTSPSSVVKSNRADTRVALWLRWLHPLHKLMRSINRHHYLWRHRAEFYPAERPHTKPGRTKRMKGVSTQMLRATEAATLAAARPDNGNHHEAT